MQVRAVFTFWLGSLDSKVALGLDSGGTHDLRFCSVEEEIERFTGRRRDANNRWDIVLQPYEAAGIDTWPITLARYTDVAREGECAMPMQYAGTQTAYPLWERTIRDIPRDSRPLDAIVLLRDGSGEFHGRVIRSSGIGAAPVWLRVSWQGRNECGTCRLPPDGSDELQEDVFYLP